MHHKTGLPQKDDRDEELKALLRPLEHLEVAPQHMQEGLLKLVQALPLLIGDDLYEALEEDHAGIRLERALKARSQLSCEVLPQAPQKLRAGKELKCPLESQARECLVILSSQRSFRSPQAPRPRLTLKDALSLSLERFHAQRGLTLILIATDAWDARLMKEHLAAFRDCLTYGQVMIPALHHGGLLTPITYL